MGLPWPSQFRPLVRNWRSRIYMHVLDASVPCMKFRHHYISSSLLCADPMKYHQNECIWIFWSRVDTGQSRSTWRKRHNTVLASLDFFRRFDVADPRRYHHMPTCPRYSFLARTARHGAILQTTDIWLRSDLGVSPGPLHLKCWHICVIQKNWVDPASFCKKGLHCVYCDRCFAWLVGLTLSGK